MSHSTREASSELRAAYTKETDRAAWYGIGRRADLGLDRCTEAQLALRSQLAWHLFNTGYLGLLPYQGSIGTIASYDFIMSPRYDEIVIIMDSALDNVMDYFFHPGRPTFPGLRLRRALEWEEGLPDPERNYERRYYRRYETVHLPTGGKLTFTTHPKTRTGIGSDRKAMRDPVGIDVPLGEDESFKLKLFPVMAPGIRRMLAALVSRFTAAAPDGRWVTGSWFNAPEGRQDDVGSGFEYSRSLAGAGAFWSLRWTRFPTVEDVALMLTDPVFGLDGVEVHRRSASVDLMLEGATLRLERV
jgi:hypothetical protein